jgi:GNAT superfamily N-acetyltransferase
MSRSSVTIRDADLGDAPALARLWADALRKVDRSDQVADLELVIKAATASSEQRLLVADQAGVVAGAAFVRLTTISPLNLEPCVQSVQARVVDEFRGQGVGRALMEATATFAEENGVLHMIAVVPSASRDAQRFMARLGLAAAATYRMAPVSRVRGRLSPTRAHGTLGVPRVLAARRSQRRARVGVEQVSGAAAVSPVAPDDGY